MAIKAQTKTNKRQRRARHGHRNVTQLAHKDRELTPESRTSKHTWDSVFNWLERPAVDPNFDDDYDSEFENSTGSRGNADLRARHT